jgi:hypothetical protein
LYHGIGSSIAMRWMRLSDPSPPPPPIFARSLLDAVVETGWAGSSRCQG